METKLGLIGFCTLTAILAAGCGVEPSNWMDEGTVADDTVPGIIDNTTGDAALLLVVGNDYLNVVEGEAVELTVLYENIDGTPIIGEPVSFQIEGTAAAASLASMSSITNPEGHATVVLNAGTPTSFSVAATADLVSQPTYFEISVLPADFGSVVYSLSYSGSRELNGAEVGVFADTSCADLVQTATNPVAAQSSAVGLERQFDGLNRALSYSIVAFGTNDDDNVAAEACADFKFEDGGSQDVTLGIVLTDVDEVVGGTYSLEERLDLAAGLDGGLLQALGFVSDPIGALVDAVAETSDLLDNSFARSAVEALLRSAFDDVQTPETLNNYSSVASDLNQALRNVTAQGELEVPEPSDRSSVSGRHNIEEITVLVGGESASIYVGATADVQISVTSSTISLGDHALPVAYGDVVETILEDIILPGLPGSPEDIRDLVEQLIDCDAIADSIAGDSSFFAPLANSTCEAGIGYLAGTVEDKILELFEYDQLHIQGSANLTDTDNDYARDLIEGDGALDIRWVGDSGELEFGGSMTGTLQDDSAGQLNSLRDRIETLL